MAIRAVSIQSSTNRRGFTLMEMALVVVIIGVVAAFAIPGLGDAVARRSVVAAADEFVLTHSLARVSAIRYGRRSELHIDTLVSRFWVTVDTNGSGIRDTVGILHDLTTGGVRTTSNRTLLCFDARGLPVTTGTCEPGDARVVFARWGTTDTVVVATLGKVLR
jgi:prepilin-type N-terminal cleavage/methylation domain-containing protein